MMLTDTACRNAKIKDNAKQIKLFDGRGLFLLCTPSGGKLWRFKYRFGGKEKLLGLGAYPDVSLADARERRENVRKLLAQGVDPSAVRKEEQAKAAEDALTFEVVARDWYEKKRPFWTPGTAERILRRLVKDLYPKLGGMPIKKVTPRQILDTVGGIEKRGAHETARRALQDCGAVFRYAFANGLVEMDPMPATRGAIVSPPVVHRASITAPQAVGALLRAIWGYEGSPATAAALKLAAFTFVRPGELRHAEWSEFDIDAAEWRIPAIKMKMRTPHIVPLSRQVLDLLEGLRPLTGSGRYLFPSERTEERPMSANTMNGALRRLGYSKQEMCCHGFRSMASTLLNEQSWSWDAIERQLAHAERNGVRSSYNFAEYLPERRRMMQSWSNYLDSLREGCKVVDLFKSVGDV